MKDENKTKKQLINELVKLRQRNAELETVETERKRAEEELRKYRMHLEITIDERTSALRESEGKLRMFFENTSDGIVLTDEKGKFLLANEAAAKNLGYTREELLKLNITDIEAVESKEEFERHYSDAIKGKRLKFETIHRKKDSSLMNVDVSLTLVRHEMRNVFAYAVWRDITERKRAEEELQKERDRAQEYLDLAGVMFVAIDIEGKVFLINKKGCEILGYYEKDIIGKNWFEYFLPKRVIDTVKPVSEKLLSGELEPVEYFENPVLTKDGEEKLIAWHNTILKDKKGNIIGHLSSGEDITERKK